MTIGGKSSAVAIIAALVSFGMMVTAVVLAGTGDTEIGLLIAFLSLIVPALIGMLRADQAQAQTNGGMDKRISDAVQEALKVRRHTDAAVVTSPIGTNDTVDNATTAEQTPQ